MKHLEIAVGAATILVLACGGQTSSGGSRLTIAGGSGGSDTQGSLAGSKSVLPIGGGDATTDPGGFAGLEGIDDSVEVPVAPCPAQTTITAIAAGAGQYVAVGTVSTHAECAEVGVLYRSSDGRSWSATVTDWASEVTDIAFGNGQFVALTRAAQDAAGTYATTIHVSNDAKEWETVVLPDIALAKEFAFGNGAFMAANTTDSGILRSTDGRSWESVGSPSSDVAASRKGIEYAAGVFALYGDTDIVHVTASGTSWTDVDATGVGSIGVNRHSLGSMHAVGNRFVADTWFNCCFGETGGPWTSLAESSDGYHWTQKPENGRVRYPAPWIETTSLCVVISQGTVMSGADCNDTELTYSSGFQASHALAAGSTFLVGGVSGMLYSIDGFTWEQVLGGTP